jgi:hypothetical protein
MNGEFFYRYLFFDFRFDHFQFDKPWSNLRNNRKHEKKVNDADDRNLQRAFKTDRLIMKPFHDDQTLDIKQNQTADKRETNPHHVCTSNV